MEHSIKKPLQHNLDRQVVSQGAQVQHTKPAGQGRVKSCLVFSLKPRTTMGGRRLRINADLED